MSSHHDIVHPVNKRRLRRSIIDEEMQPLQLLPCGQEQEATVREVYIDFEHEYYIDNRIKLTEVGTIAVHDQQALLDNFLESRRGEFTEA